MNDIQLTHDQIIFFVRVRRFMRPGNALVSTKLSRITDAITTEFERVKKAWDEAAQRFAKRTDAVLNEDGTVKTEGKPIQVKRENKSGEPKDQFYMLTGTPYYEIGDAEQEQKLDAELKELRDAKCTVRAPRLTQLELRSISVVDGDIGDALNPFEEEEQ